MSALNAPDRPDRSPESDTEALLQRGYRYALALTHDVARAEDLVQDAFLAVLRRGGPDHPGYLLRTIRNRFIDQYCRRKPRAFEGVDALVDPGSEEDDDGFADFDPEHVEGALGQLTSAEREAVYLAYVEGYSARQIADLFERPRPTILGLMHRARHKMRAFLDAVAKEATS